MFGAIEGGIEGRISTLWEIDAAHVFAGFCGTVEALHAAVFPFDAEWSIVLDVIESDDDFLEIDITTAYAAEVPVAAGIAKICMAAEDPDGAVAVAEPHILHVNVVDAVGELVNKLHVIDPLVGEVGGIVVQAEAWVVVEGGEGALGGCDIKRDFRGVNFEAEINIFFFKRIHDGEETLGEVVESFLQVFLGGGREGVEGVPDGRASEAIDDAFFRCTAGSKVEEFPAGSSGVDEFFGCALADAFGFTVAPNVLGQDGFVAFIDEIADGLAYEVGGNGEAGQACIGELLPFGFAVAGFMEGALDIEVVAPASELYAVVAHFFNFREEISGR